MNKDYEVFVEDIAREWWHRYLVLAELRRPMDWEHTPEELRRTVILSVKSLIEDGHITPGPVYLHRDVHPLLPPKPEGKVVICDATPEITQVPHVDHEVRE